MQPYLFPYIGYFQMVAAADKFVFYDDVNFIKNGWINRNRCLHQGKAHYFTVPLSNAGSFREIHEVEIQPDTVWRRKMLALIRHAYAKAPCFDPVFQLFEQTICADQAGIGEMAKQSVSSVMHYLGFDAQIVWSSSRYGNRNLKGEARVIDICRHEGATDYVNLPGGRSLYQPQAFADNGIRLEFIAPNLKAYDQRAASFVPGLSIIDVLMFNPPEEVRRMVTKGEGEE
ncbi:WbqC family protein [Noviherbaspirillum humi]|nr:WbqC family protein [Noviherbaspirillum humi]